MIIVLADDLSGAAELAGASLRHGLTAEIHRRFEPTSGANVICLDTDSRRLTEKEASNCLKSIVNELRKVRPKWIYKKTDSVLRGNVRAEIQAILKQTGQSRSLLIPANPTKGRIIRKGRYYIDEIPLHETVFALDPEHPRHTSSVAELLKGTNESGPSNIHFPDAMLPTDLESAAGQIDDATLPAGGVEFFQALLARNGFPCLGDKMASEPTSAETHRLFVCGSAAAWSSGRQRQCKVRRIPISVMPPSLFDPTVQERALADWAAHAACELQCSRCLMLAIGQLPHPLSFPPEELAHRLAEVIQRILSAAKVGQLFLEGGATAAALIHRLGWSRLIAQSVLSGHLAALQSPLQPGTQIFIKPGSYDWPDQAWPVAS